MSFAIEQRMGMIRMLIGRLRAILKVIVLVGRLTIIKKMTNGLGVQTLAMRRKGPKTNEAFQFLVAQWEGARGRFGWTWKRS